METASVDDRLYPQARQREDDSGKKHGRGDGRIQHDRREATTRENDRLSSRLVPAA